MMEISGSTTPQPAEQTEKSRLRKAPRPCFLIARPRSGATVFNRMLRTHPKVVGLGEIFNESNDQSYFHFLRELAAEDRDVVFPSKSTSLFLRYLDQCKTWALQRKPNCEIMILSVKYDQAHLLCDPWWRVGQLPKLLFLMRDKKWKVLDIHREDTFKLCVSNQVAIQTNIYHSNTLRPGENHSAKVHIDPDQILRDIAATNAVYAAFIEHFKGMTNYKMISYETMFEDASGGKFSGPLLEEVGKFLGLKSVFDPKPKLEKLLQNDIFSHIENADEIRELIL